MNQIQEKVLIASVLNWIREYRLRSNSHPTEITENLDLLKNGLLDSLALVDLLLFVEEQTGRPIDLKTVEPEDICIVKNLCRIALGKLISQPSDECETCRTP